MFSPTFIRLTILVVVAFPVVYSQTLVGGAGDVKPADDMIRSLLSQIKPKLEKRLNEQFTKFEPVSYREQLVNGFNYFIKIKVGDDRHIHARIYKSFDGSTVQLNNFQDKLKASDPVVYMDGNFSD